MMSEQADLSGKVAASLGLVIGGTVAGLSAAFPGDVLQRAMGRMARAFVPTGEERVELADLAMRLSDKARREGLLSLEDDVRTATPRSMQAGLTEVVDGAPPRTIETVLRAEAATERRRGAEIERVCEFGARLAVGLGAAGTLIGLAQAISDAGGVRRRAGEALLPAACGLLSAALFWRPMGQRVALQNEASASTNEMAQTAVLAIQQGETPGLIRARMEALLGPDERAKVKASWERLRATVVRPRPSVKQDPEHTTDNPALRSTAAEDVEAFRFEDVVRLGRSDIKRVVRELDSKGLALALRGVSEEVQAAIYSGMSGRAAHDIHECMSLMGPQRISAIEEAKRSVEDVVRRLAQHNEIAVPKRQGGTG